MTRPSTATVAASQVPAAGERVLDHVAHFVPHMDSTGSALEKLGFTLTPFSEHSQPSGPGGPLVPAGSGNRCVMLERGYLEFVTPTGDTRVASELRAAIKRYTGPHLVAFGTCAPEADQARLAKAGFAPLDPVALQREIGTPSGTGTVRFTVVRVPPGTMPEGRIQFCRQDTPELLWQPRWIEHANGALALNGVVLCVADPEEAAQRFGRYCGLLARPTGGVWRIVAARGYLLFLDRDTLQRRLGVVPPSLPWIAGCALRSADIAATSETVRRAGNPVRALPGSRLLVEPPAAVGGIMIFEPESAGVLQLD